MSVFYQIGTEEGNAEGDSSSRQMTDEQQNEYEARRGQEHEFKIGCVGVSLAVDSGQASTK